MIGFFEFHIVHCLQLALINYYIIYKFNSMMFGMCKTKYSCKDCNRCLFIVSKINILCSSGRTCELINRLLWTSYKTFISLKYLFHFFLPVFDCTFYKSAIKSNCVLLLCHQHVRSSRQEEFCKKDILRDFAKFPGKHLC